MALIESLTADEIIARLATKATETLAISRLISATVVRPHTVAFPSVHSAPPTVAFAQTGSTTIGGTPQELRPTSEQAITMLGMVPKWNATNLAMESYSNDRGSYGGSCEITSDVVEFFWRSASTGGYYWVWIDDQPCTAAPVAWAASSAATCRLLITFPGVESHRITVYSDLLQLKTVRVTAGHSIEATYRSPVRFMAVGDSLTEGSAEAIPQRTWLSHTAKLLGWEPIMNAVGGTGYVNGTKPFTHVDRITAMEDDSIDFYHFKGSVNDDPESAAIIQAGAQTCFEAIWQANSKAVILVSGPDPTGGTSSLGAAVRANSDAVRSAAMEYSDKNVIGWVDPLMTKDAVAWSSGGSYVIGDRVTHQGGVYVCVKDTTTSGFNSIDFARISPLYGTGTVAAPASNGNRDQFILSDAVHWSLAGHQYFGRYFADHYAKALKAYSRGEFYIHE